MKSRARCAKIFMIAIFFTVGITKNAESADCFAYPYPPVTTPSGKKGHDLNKCAQFCSGRGYNGGWSGEQTDAGDQCCCIKGSSTRLNAPTLKKP